MDEDLGIDSLFQERPDTPPPTQNATKRRAQSNAQVQQDEDAPSFLVEELASDFESNVWRSNITELYSAAIRVRGMDPDNAHFPMLDDAQPIPRHRRSPIVVYCQATIKRPPLCFVVFPNEDYDSVRIKMEKQMLEFTGAKVSHRTVERTIVEHYGNHAAGLLDLNNVRDILLDRNGKRKTPNPPLNLETELPKIGSKFLPNDGIDRIVLAPPASKRTHPLMYFVPAHGDINTIRTKVEKELSEDLEAVLRSRKYASEARQREED